MQSKKLRGKQEIAIDEQWKKTEKEVDENGLPPMFKRLADLQKAGESLQMLRAGKRAPLLAENSHEDAMVHEDHENHDAHGDHEDYSDDTTIIV